MVDKLPFLPVEHHYAITAVVTRAAQLDHQVEYIILAAMRLRARTAKYLLKNLNSDRLTGLLQAILLDVWPRQDAEINDAIAEIKRLRAERNDIIHWIWGRADDPEGAKHGDRRPFRDWTERSRTAEEIQKIADDMLGVGLTLHRWHEALAAAPPPPPSRPLPDILALLARRANSSSPSDEDH